MANRHCDFLYGRDDTGTGDVLAPFQTMAVGLSIARGWVTGDTVVLHNDEILSASITLPANATRLLANSVIGVNKTTGLEDGSRIKITQTGAVANFIYQDVTTATWSFRNLQIEGFTTVLRQIGTTIYCAPDWFNCKFNLCGAFAATIGTTGSANCVFSYCYFEDCTHAGNYGLSGTTTYFGSYYSCTFRRCSTPAATSYAMLAAYELIDCAFIDCSTSRYGPKASRIVNLVIDRFTLMGTGNVDNVVISESINSVILSTFMNILVTNVAFSNTPTTAKTAIMLLNSSGYTRYVCKNIAYYNAPTSTPSVKLSTTIDTSLHNFMVELTESPWKNDDGIIGNPMTAYEYKGSYEWRNKQQALLSVSGWGFLL
jgi:hypothetical protein